MNQSKTLPSNGGVRERTFDSFSELLGFVQDLSRDRRSSWVFRGHSSSENRLLTSMERYSSLRIESWELRVERMLDVFRDSLIRNGLPYPDTTSLLDWMEFGRHHGVPSPLLDFTWSPNVALFFAYNGLARKVPEDSLVALYALNLERLSTAWAIYQHREDSGCSVGEAANKFRYPNAELLESRVPEDTLVFIPYPGERSSRMQRQFGAFLCSTLNYKRHGAEDLEGFLDVLAGQLESTNSGAGDSPMMIKIYSPVGLASDVLSHLELAGATGASLYSSADGAAQDTWNSYRHNQKFFLRESPLLDKAIRAAERDSSK